MKLYLTNGEVYAPGRIYKPGAILIEGNVITAVGLSEDIPAPADARVLDASGKRVIPGLIDLHLHGALGYDVSGAGLENVIRCLPAEGITSFLPTTAFLTSADSLRDNLRVMAGIIANPPAGAQVLGIHMEGPWVAADRSPFSKAELCYALTQPDIEQFQEASGGNVRMITFAPELGQAMQVIPWLVEHGIVPSIGHTNADYQTVRQAVALGLNHATHTFNAMRPLHHRNPGTLGAVLDFDQIFAQMIADGFHVHPAAMRLLIKAKGTDRVCIVSDAVPTAGLPAGSQINWEGFQLVTDGETSRLLDGRPGGAAMLMNRMLKVLVQSGIDFGEAVKMASQVPSAVLGAHKGQLKAGFDADVVILNDKYEAVMTIITGNIVHSA